MHKRCKTNPKYIKIIYELSSSRQQARRLKPSRATAVRHDRACRAKVVPNLTVTQPAELNGFKRRATAVPKSNLILEFSSARQ